MTDEELKAWQIERWNSGAQRYRKKPGFVDVGYTRSAYLNQYEDYKLKVVDICDMLSASRGWVDKYIVPYVKHIYLPAYDAQLFYSISDFWHYWEQNAKAYTQKLPDVLPYKTEEPPESDYWIMFNQLNERREKFVTEYIKKRKEIPWSEIPLPQNKIGQPVKEYEKKLGVSRESVLRNFFANEAIKIIFFGKVFWVDPKA